MKKNQVLVFHTSDDLAAYFAEKLAVISQICPDNAYVSIALSGGSTPRAIFAFLSQQKNYQIMWDKIRIFWGDERCVPPNHEESNYRMTHESLLSNIPIPAENIFRIQGEEDPTKEAARYSKLVASHVPFFENNPVFDLVMLGLGEDGHTASIFPPDKHLFDSPYLFVATQHPDTGQPRISATGRVINHARHVFFIVSGKSKADMVAHILDKRKGYDNLPASKVMPGKDKLFWLLDQEAAQKVTRAVRVNVWSSF